MAASKQLLLICLCLASIILSSIIEASPTRPGGGEVVPPWYMQQDKDVGEVSTAEGQSMGGEEPELTTEGTNIGDNGAQQGETADSQPPWHKFCMDNLAYYAKLENKPVPQSFADVIGKIKSVVGTVGDVVKVGGEAAGAVVGAKGK